MSRKERHLDFEIQKSSIRNQANKVYTKAKSYYYACRNKRGFTILETGRFKRRVKERDPRTSQNLILTLIWVFLGPSPSVFSGKKSRFITGDVTVGT